MARRATLDSLRSKRPAEKTVSLTVHTEEGPEEQDMLFRAIGHHEYDRLVTKFPPTAQQKKDGLTYDIERFGPSLLSRVCVDPPMTEDDAHELWNSGQWNRGEITALFLAAVDVCNRGLDVPPTDVD
jgi:hypothetical protein